jgi:hypothetical protein
MTDYHRRTTCRACGSGDLVEVLDMGEMPLANAFIEPENAADEKQYPLTLAFCRACSLLQTPDVVDPAILFGDYPYATGASAPLVEHFRKYVHDAIDPLITGGDLVVDIGGNDGTLLNFVKGSQSPNESPRVLNIDPAAPALDSILSVTLPFSAATSRRVVDRFGQAKVVTANNVLAHVDDLLDFLKGVRHLLADDGTFIFETHWVKDLIDRTGYDQVYHEHLCYFSMHSLAQLFGHAGLRAYDVKIVKNHGESLRVFASKSDHCGHSRPTRRDTVADCLIYEKAAALDKEQTYLDFVTRAQAHRELLRDLVYDLVDGGARVIGYGAPAKGTTLLNYCGIGSDLDFVVDGSPSKQDKMVPGVHVPIVSPDELKTDSPNYALLLSWNYADHILAKEQDLRARGTKFIVPFPEIRIV